MIPHSQGTEKPHPFPEQIEVAVTISKCPDRPFISQDKTCTNCCDWLSHHAPWLLRTDPRGPLCSPTAHPASFLRTVQGASLKSSLRHKGKSYRVGRSSLWRLFLFQEKVSRESQLRLTSQAPSLPVQPLLDPYASPNPKMLLLQVKKTNTLHTRAAPWATGKPDARVRDARPGEAEARP